MSTFWLVTISTYGQWLPGDPRGFQTRRHRKHVDPPARYARAGQPTYDPAPYDSLHRRARRETQGAVTLSRQQQGVALHAMVGGLDELAGQRLVIPRILSIGRWHAHLVARFPGRGIRRSAGQLKAAASRRLGPPPAPIPRWWASLCHMKGLQDGPAFRNGVQYVRRHVSEGDLGHEWSGQFPEV